MKKQVLSIAFITFVIAQAKAQVKDVSVIITPTAGYNWFDKKTTVEDGLMYGVQAGFGFGQNIELRGIYERSADLKQAFGEYEADINDVIPGFEFQPRNVRVTRIGGEFKANIPAKGFAPYFTLGTGVQTFERNYANIFKYKSESLYGSGGLGVKINLGNRVTFNVEGKGYSYNMNPSSLLYNPSGSSEFDEWLNNQERTRMINFSVNAGLQIYLGGSNYGDMTELDRAYYQKFSSGMSGVKFTLSPIGGFADFNKSAAYKNSYFLGGQLGVDLSEFVGLKAYYMQGVDPRAEEFEFDKISMYGADFVGKLNVSRGIVPFISVGGGYLNVDDDYQGRNIGSTLFPIYQPANSSYFAKGGVGVEIPLTQHIEVFGAANLMYTMNTQNEDVLQLVNTDQLQQHAFYNAGIRLKLGRSSRENEALERTFNNEFSPERQAYNNRIKELEKELNEAYKNNDADKAAQIIEEKKKIDKQNSEKSNQSDKIRLTPAELESMIDKVIDGVENENTPNIENRLERLELLLIDLNKGQNTTYNEVQYRNQRTMSQQQVAPLSDNSGYQAINDRLITEINTLKQQIAQQNDQINTLRNNQVNTGTTTVIGQPNTYYPPQTTLPIVSQPGTVAGVTPVAGVLLNYGMGVFAGANFGEATAFNIGIRSYWGLSNSNFIFMPDLYFSFAEVNGFGVNANAAYQFKNNSPITPYLGLGLGLNYINDNFSFNPNFIGGVSYSLGPNMSSVFADYTARGAFKNNQIAIGYRFKF